MLCIGRSEIKRVEAVDELRDYLFDAALFLSVGGLFEGVPEFAEFGVEFSGMVHDVVAHFVADAGFATFVKEVEVA